MAKGGNAYSEDEEVVECKTESKTSNKEEKMEDEIQHVDLSVIPEKNLENDVEPNDELLNTDTPKGQRSNSKDYRMLDSFAVMICLIIVVFVIVNNAVHILRRSDSKILPIEDSLLIVLCAAGVLCLCYELYLSCARKTSENIDKNLGHGFYIILITGFIIAILPRHVVDIVIYFTGLNHCLDSMMIMMTMSLISIPFACLQSWFLLTKYNTYTKARRSFRSLMIMLLVALNVCQLMSAASSMILDDLADHGLSKSPVTLLREQLQKRANSSNTTNVPESPFETDEDCFVPKTSFIQHLIRRTLYPSVMIYHISSIVLLIIMWFNIDGPEDDSEVKNKEEKKMSIYRKIFMKSGGFWLGFSVAIFGAVVIAIDVSSCLTDKLFDRTSSVNHLFVCYRFGVYLACFILSMVAIYLWRRVNYQLASRTKLWPDRSVLLFTVIGPLFIGFYKISTSKIYEDKHANENFSTFFSICSELLMTIQVTLQSLFLLDGLNRIPVLSEKANSRRYRFLSEVTTVIMLFNLILVIFNFYDIEAPDNLLERFDSIWDLIAWRTVTRLFCPLAVYYRILSIKCFLDIVQNLNHNKGYQTFISDISV